MLRLTVKLRGSKRARVLQPRAVRHRIVTAGIAAALALATGGVASATSGSLYAGVDQPGLADVTSPGLTVGVYPVSETFADPVTLPLSTASGTGTILWGYESAATAARILAYNIAPPSVGPAAQCVPPGSQNGRGIAFDPLDGNLWYTFVTFPGFNGDGLIHKATPPPACAPAGVIPFGDGLGGVMQDDIGAIDVDPPSKHLWVAGYKPVTVEGVARSYLYLVNRSSGAIIQHCWVPFGGGGIGNDTLTVANLPNLPGQPDEVLLTDAGEPVTPDNVNSLLAVDITTCKRGEPGEIVAEFQLIDGKTGIDYEWPGLLQTDGFGIFDRDDKPFTTPQPISATGTPTELEDVSLCGFRATFGGDGNDMCPVP